MQVSHLKQPHDNACVRLNILVSMHKCSDAGSCPLPLNCSGAPDLRCRETKFTCRSTQPFLRSSLTFVQPADSSPWAKWNAPTRASFEEVIGKEGNVCRHANNLSVHDVCVVWFFSYLTPPPSIFPNLTFFDDESVPTSSTFCSFEGVPSLMRGPETFHLGQKRKGLLAVQGGQSMDALHTT